ncbi:MAG: adenosine deaminase, partial [Candidatus Marinimicrobia bacterium]|nr:adenosine deaminase [Candidatus Neomarinimicrobiota bacterium]
DSELVAYLSTNQIPVEMCPISNVRTSAIASLAEHPIYDFYKKGIIVSINTDDPKMFNTTLEKEYISLIETFNLNLTDIYQLSTNSINSTWCSSDIKNTLQTELTEYYKKLVN